MENFNSLSGHPATFSCMFGRSLAPKPGAVRTYELFLHGTSDTLAQGWLRSLADEGLSVRERQRGQSY